MGSERPFGRGVFRSLLLLLLLLPLSAGSLNRLEKISMGYDRLTLKFSRPLPNDDVRQFVLKGKHSIRFVYDFFHTRLASRHLLDGIRYNRQRLLSIRLSQYRKSTVRLVIETTEPYATEFYPLSEKSYTLALPKGSSSPKGLFAGLSKRKKPAAAARKPIKKKAAATKTVAKKAGKSTKATPATRRSSRAPKQLSNQPSATKSSRLMKKPSIRLKRRYTVILDPGHGGHDSGALDPSRRYQEKRAILAIARRVRKHLKSMGFRVLMTRSSDRFVKLHRRTRYANLKHGDIFISIHANAVGRPSHTSKVHGIETYYLSPARSARARRVAAKENSIAFRKYYKDSMNVYLRTLTRSKIVLSNKLALDVQRSMLSRLRKKYRGVVDGGVRPAPFWVLVGAEMPAILVETGYITHPLEKKRLYSSAYQDLLARGIAEGVARFLANRERELE